MGSCKCFLHVYVYVLRFGLCFLLRLEVLVRGQLWHADLLIGCGNLAGCGDFVSSVVFVAQLSDFPHKLAS